MTLLITGLVLFIGIHLLPSIPPLRRVLVARLGELPYKGLFALVALAGVVLMVIGMRGTPAVTVWTPPPWGRPLLYILMPVAFTLFFAARLPTNIKRVTRHPQLWGVTLWAACHLLSNGDLAGMVLFAALAGFSLLDMLSANLRGAVKSTQRHSPLRDLVAVIIGLAAYGVTLLLHPAGFLH